MGKTTASVLLAGLLLAGLAPAAARAQEGLVVKEIVFEGNRRWGTSSLKVRIETKEGERFSEKELDRDVSELLGFFRRVTVSKEVVDGGLRIVFVVEENPEVTSVICRDFSAISREDIDREVFTKKGYPFAEFRVQRDRQRLVEILKREGFYFAEVNAAVGDYAGGKQVVFTAVEGPRVNVDDIVFVGNESFGEGDLRDQMLLRVRSLLRPGRFVERTLRQDLISIADFYRDEGYLDAVVTLRDLSFTGDNEYVVITIGVTEGRPYRISRVEIAGGESFPEDRTSLRQLLRVEEGAVRRVEDIEESRRRLGNYYLENAYYDADVRVESDDDSAARTSVLRFVVREGRPARIRRIDLEGNVVTRDDVIRRNLSIRAGGPLNSVELRKSMSRLEALGYFEAGSLDYDILDTDAEGVKDVEISLAEGRTGSLQFAGTFGSDAGFALVFGASKQNFDYRDVPDDWYNPASSLASFISGEHYTGGGQSLALSLSPGTSLSSYRLAFNEPWFLSEYLFYGPSDEVEESPFAFGFEFYHLVDVRLSYDEKRTGIELHTGKVWRRPGGVFDDVVRAHLSFRWESVDIDELEDDAPPNAFVFEGRNAVRKMSLVLGFTRVDLPSYPGEGFELDATYTLGGGPFGGDVDFHLLEAGGTVYKTLYTTRDESRHILSLSGRVGWARESGSTDQVPIYERFFAGGLSTVRGFDYAEVGPRASGNPFTDAGREQIMESIARGRGQPTGGEAMWLARLEYGVPVYEPVLRGVVFVDAGNVTDTWTDDLLKTYRVAAGFGIRLKIPLLGPVPLALDLGWPLRKERGDGTRVLSFFIDRPF